MKEFPTTEILRKKWFALVGGSLGVVGVTYAALKLRSYLSQRRIPKYAIKFEKSSYGGHLFAEAFSNQNVKFVFTLTGGHIAPILIGCKEMGIKVIDVRHEVNTAFAADAVSRLSGVPGVAIVTAGPGVANTITAVKNAQMAQSPLVLIGGATSDLLKGMGSLQDIDQFAMIKPHVKWMTHVSCVKDIVPAVEKAFQKAQEGTPGPVFIEVPLDILYREATARDFYEKQTPKGSSLMSRVTAWFIHRHLEKIFSGLAGNEITFSAPLQVNYPLASSGQISRVAQYLSTAKKPVLMIGSQATLCNDEVISGELTDAIVKMGIPTILSGMARGLLGQHPKMHCRQKEARRKALKEADVVILCGAPCDFRLNYGQSIGGGATFISVNRDVTDLYKNKRPSYAINGDPCKFLLRLSEAVGEGLSKNWSEWHNALSEKDLENEEKIKKDVERSSSSELGALAVCSAVESVAAKNSIFVADGGDFVGTAAYILRPRGPLTWLDPGAFGTLGVGAGFALGAKLVRPESEVWIIYGDGALGFSMIEFDTFVRHNIPVIAVIGNDACWTQIKRDQVTFFNGEDVGTALAFTNYHEAVKGLGAEGLIVTKPSELQTVLQQAKQIAEQQKKPVLVNCILKEKSDFREGSLSM